MAGDGCSPYVMDLKGRIQESCQLTLWAVLEVSGGQGVGGVLVIAFWVERRAPATSAR